MSGLSAAFLTRMKGICTASTTRYKATLHYGASRPTAATTTYAATGLGELATTTASTYTTGGAGLTGGIQIVSTATGTGITFTDKVLTTGATETIGPYDTVAIWDTTNSNELVAVIDVAAGQQTASNGGTITLDFQAATISFAIS